MSDYSKRFAQAAALAVALLAASGSPAAAAPEAPEGEIVIAQPVLRQQYDPTAMVATTDFLAFDMLYDGLLNLTAEGKEPALATSWEISEDGKQIDFKLREDVRFHNGDPMTAEDVKFTFDTILDPENTHSYRQAFVESVDHIEVLSPHKVRFVLKQPWPGFFTSNRYALVGIVPKKYYEEVGSEGFQQNPIGTGPFKLADQQAGEWIRFEANEDYWGGAPDVAAVTERLVAEPFTRYAMLERGEADIAMGLTGPLLERIRSNPEIRVISAEYSGTSGLHFSRTEFPESANRDVRLAIAHAIDREGIVQSILAGICESAPSIFTPATFGHLPGLEPIPYDPEKAKQMLRDAGIEPGHEVSFSIHTESFGSLPNAPQVLEAIAGNLEAVGFEVDRQPFETGAWLAMMRAGNQPGIFYGPSSMPDDGGETINGWYSSDSVWSSGNVNVPEYDEIFRKQLQESDPEKREKLLQEFARMEHERLEAVPLFWCDTPFAVSDRIAEWRPGLGSGYHLSLDDLKLAE